MSVFTRAELERILAARQAAGMTENQGTGLEFRIRMTPEALQAVMDGYFVSSGGTKAKLEAIEIENDFATPIFTRIE